MNDRDVLNNLRIVKEKIHAAWSKKSQGMGLQLPRLVAVSKTQPIDAIVKAYEIGQRHFGENYVQELAEKASDAKVLTTCCEIKWHYIGHLQRNKVNKLMGIPNLYSIETIHSEKIATAINNYMSALSGQDKKINVFVQVNTSGEQEKSGCKPDEVVNLVKYVIDRCPFMNVMGLMTIGLYDNYNHVGENEDFLTLIKCREMVCTQLNININNLELSMGMSADYESAIEVGSTNVRVGQSIFGPRNTKLMKEFKKQELADNEN